MRSLAKRSRSALAVAALALLPASALVAGRRTDDLLALVPADAASVAVVRLNELRSSPLASKLFSHADHLTTDGDAARFMEETHLRPKEDVDTVVIVGMPLSATGESSALAIFEGRFDPERLSAAVEARGAVRKTAPSGDYYLLPERAGSASRGGPGAVAFVGPRLVIAGSEPAVLRALASREAGGTAFSSGSGLGRHLNRIDRGASVWALVDVARYPTVRRGIQREEGRTREEPAAALLSAMKSVQLFAFEASARADGLDLSATGLSADEETRTLLEDSLRGALAMLRLATQEKSPELVSVLRKFQVRRNGDGVTVSGTLPASVLRTLAEKRTEKGNR